MASIISNVYKLAMKIYGAIIGTDVDSLCKYLEKDRAATPSAKLYSECHIAKLLFNNKYSYYVIKKKGVKTHTKAIIYLPGGGFILPLTVTHFSYIERLSKTTNAVIYILLYPLSTKNYSSCFDINQFIVDFYKKLLKKFAASDITIMGDSAGGTLALTGAYQIKLNNLPVPENIISISPCARLNFSDWEAEAFSELDEVLPAALLTTAWKWYVGANDPTDPRFSPYFCDFKGMKNILIVIGSSESFYIPVIELSEKLRKADVKHKLMIGKKMFHVFPLFAFPEGDKVNDVVFSLIAGKEKDGLSKFNNLKNCTYIN